MSFLLSCGDNGPSQEPITEKVASGKYSKLSFKKLEKLNESKSEEDLDLKYDLCEEGSLECISIATEYKNLCIDRLALAKMLIKKSPTKESRAAYQELKVELENKIKVQENLIQDLRNKLSKNRSDYEVFIKEIISKLESENVCKVKAKTCQDFDEYSLDNIHQVSRTLRSYYLLYGEITKPKYELSIIENILEENLEGAAGRKYLKEFKDRIDQVAFNMKASYSSEKYSFERKLKQIGLIRQYTSGTFSGLNFEINSSRERGLIGFELPDVVESQELKRVIGDILLKDDVNVLKQFGLPENMNGLRIDLSDTDLPSYESYIYGWILRLNYNYSFAENLEILKIREELASSESFPIKFEISPNLDFGTTDSFALIRSVKKYIDEKQPVWEEVLKPLIDLGFVKEENGIDIEVDPFKNPDTLGSWGYAAGFFILKTNRKDGFDLIPDIVEKQQAHLKVVEDFKVRYSSEFRIIDNTNFKLLKHFTLQFEKLKFLSKNMEAFLSKLKENHNIQDLSNYKLKFTFNILKEEVVVKTGIEVVEITLNPDESDHSIFEDFLK